MYKTASEWSYYEYEKSSHYDFNLTESQGASPVLTCEPSIRSGFTNYVFIMFSVFQT